MAGEFTSVREFTAPFIAFPGLEGRRAVLYYCANTPVVSASCTMAYRAAHCARNSLNRHSERSGLQLHKGRGRLLALLGVTGWMWLERSEGISLFPRRRAAPPAQSEVEGKRSLATREEWHPVPLVVHRGQLTGLIQPFLAGTQVRFYAEAWDNDGQRWRVPPEGVFSYTVCADWPARLRSRLQRWLNLATHSLVR